MDFATLAPRLEAADYTFDAVMDRLGELGQAGLTRNSTVAADRELGQAVDPQAALIRLFLLQQAVPEHQVAEVLPLDELERAGHLVRQGDRVKAQVDIRPYGSPDDGASGWIVADPTPGMDFRQEQTRPDYVLGVSPASTSLAQMVARQDVDRALDLGTGCGVQSLHLARHVKTVVATDVNERALELAAATAALNGTALELRAGSLYEPVAGERFDLIVSNPPFVMSPPTKEEDTLAYRETNLRGDLLVETLVRGASDHLTPGGSLQLLTNWAIMDDQWQQRLLSWAPADCDMWVVERERLDVYAYIEMWLADAGLAGTSQWREAYDQWLDYFASLGIEAVGMGWIQVTRAQREIPHREAESWPHAVAQPVGPVFAHRRAAVDAYLLGKEELLASSPYLSEVDQETIGQPGAEDPEHIVFRQRSGLRRAFKADTATAAIFGALDGELTVGQIIAAVAQILDVNEAELTEQVLPELRTALLHGMLVMA